MTPIADMVAKMLAAGVSPELVALAVATAETCASAKTSTDASVDTASNEVLALKRQADRERKKIARIKRLAGKQTMPGASESVHETSVDASVDKDVDRCDLLSYSGTQKGPSVRKKGTRLAKSEQVSAENYTYAECAGIPPSEIQRVWDEFVDYWIGVPGQRGTKLDWDATWRNRVRALTPWKGRGGNGPRPSTLAAVNDLIAKAESGSFADGPIIEHEPH